MRFAFIHAEKAFFPIAAMCRLLSVTRQGYYAYATRAERSRAV
jgi:putative transposase